MNEMKGCGGGHRQQISGGCEGQINKQRRDKIAVQIEIWTDKEG